ncbi:hypothetical protein NUKP55_14170 [Klebsiella variicola]|nr:hypothetical protein NUKP55_14170 [Klebsiella variicola]GKM93444.1 hypothetical protein NUKP76_11200 [Klebsiella variicola]
MSGFPRGVIPPVGPRRRSAAGRDTRLRSGFTARWRLAPYRAYCLTGPGMSGIPRGVISLCRPAQAQRRRAG